MALALTACEDLLPARAAASDSAAQAEAPETQQAAPSSSTQPSRRDSAYVRLAHNLRQLEQDRERFYKAWQQASAEGKERVRAQARERLIDAIVEEILPAWIGTPWDFNGIAAAPGDEPVACGYFVTAVLESSGTRLSSRTRFSQSTALRIQRSLTPAKRDLHRVFSVPAEALERRLLELGDGLYIIGLNVHVGFVVVRHGRVHFVHSSYTDEQRVVDEPLVSAKAIALSRETGYFITPLFHDARSIDTWLRHKIVQLRPDDG